MTALCKVTTTTPRMRLLSTHTHSYHLINISFVYYDVLSDNIMQNGLYLPDFLTVVVVFVYQRQEDGKLLDSTKITLTSKVGGW